MVPTPAKCSLDPCAGGVLLCDLIKRKHTLSVSLTFSVPRTEISPISKILTAANNKPKGLLLLLKKTQTQLPGGPWGSLPFTWIPQITSLLKSMELPLDGAQ